MTASRIASILVRSPASSLMLPLRSSTSRLSIGWGVAPLPVSVIWVAGAAGSLLVTSSAIVWLFRSCGVYVCRSTSGGSPGARVTLGDSVISDHCARSGSPAGVVSSTETVRFALPSLWMHERLGEGEAELDLAIVENRALDPEEWRGRAVRTRQASPGRATHWRRCRAIPAALSPASRCPRPPTGKSCRSSRRCPAKAAGSVRRCHPADGRRCTARCRGSRRQPPKVRRSAASPDGRAGRTRSPRRNRSRRAREGRAPFRDG